jgi:hypothetical protein
MIRDPSRIVVSKPVLKVGSAEYYRKWAWMMKRCHAHHLLRTIIQHLRAIRNVVEIRRKKHNHCCKCDQSRKSVGRIQKAFPMLPLLPILLRRYWQKHPASAVLANF